MKLGLQGWIHKLEVAQGSRLIKLIAAWLALAALIAWYDLREFKNLHSEEAMDLAQVARNLAEGKGFSTDFIRPLSLHLVEQRANAKLEALPPDAPPEKRDALVARARLRTPHPDLANGPLYPLLLAGWMKLLPFDYQITVAPRQFRHYQPDVLIAFLNQAWLVVLLVLTFFLARRLFDEPVAWLTVVILAGTELIWKFSVSGLPTLMLMTFTVGIVGCLAQMDEAAREETPPGQRWFILRAALVGLLLGLGGLTRYSFLALAVPVVVFFLLHAGARRASLCLTTLAVCALVTLPWLLRNYEWSGTLFGTAGFAVQEETLPFPGNRLPRSLSPDLNQVGPADYLRKVTTGLGEAVSNDLPRLGGSWITAFFLVGLLMPFINPTLSRLRGFLLMSLAVLTVSQALGRSHLSTDQGEVSTENLLVLLAPLVFAYGVAFYYVLLEQVRLPFPELRQAVTALVALLVCAPLILTFLPPRSYPVAYPPYFPPMTQQVAGWMGEDEWMMSDMPWAVAWYGHRTCVWTTLDYAKDSDFYAIHDFRKPLHGLFLTPLTTDAKLRSQMMLSPEHAWGRFLLDGLLRTNLPPGFPLRHAPRGFLPDHLFLSDWERWKADRN